MVADEHEGWVETREKFSYDPVEEIVMPVDKTPVVDTQTSHINLYNIDNYIISILDSSDKGIEPPL